jgi:hypothetical protein
MGDRNINQTDLLVCSLQISHKSAIRFIARLTALVYNVIEVRGA